MRRDVFVLPIVAVTLIGAPWFTTFARAGVVPHEVLSLDGSWEIIFDPANKGREAGWHRDGAFSAVAGRRTIVVPSCWELTEKDYEGVAFYRRKFKVPKSWQGKAIRLQFDAVNFLAEVWLNDRRWVFTRVDSRRSSSGWTDL